MVRNVLRDRLHVFLVVVSGIIFLLERVPTMRAFSVRGLTASTHRRLQNTPSAWQRQALFYPNRFSTASSWTAYGDKSSHGGSSSADHRISSSVFPLQATSSSSVGDEKDPVLADLEEEITFLNSGMPINVNSPKQVSVAIFGQSQSTSRAVLLQAAQGIRDNETDQQLLPLTEKQQRLAALVLECRGYRSRKSCQEETTLTNSKNIASSTVDENVMNNIVTEESLSSKTEKTSRSDNSMVHENNEMDRKKSQPPQAPLNPNDASQYERMVDALFENDQNQIHDSWKDVLKQVTRPSARALVAQLDSTSCPMGFNHLAVPHDPLRGITSDEHSTASTTTAGKKGSYIHFCRGSKKKYPDCVIVTRCGDFYETFGVDAILLVEHCGLNAMGGKVRAGFPYRAIQASLDCLTQKGFRVAVYEEAADTDASSGAGAIAGPKARLKTRMLAQVISPASPSYMYDLVLLGNAADTLATAIPARPYMGVISTTAGYTLVEISIEERSVRVSERLTAEAMACRLAAYPPASPLLLVPSSVEYQSSKETARMTPFLPSTSCNDRGTRLSVKVIPPSLVPEPKAGVDDIERARTTIVSALLQMTEFDGDEMEEKDNIVSRRRARVDDFTLIASPHNPTVSKPSLAYPAPIKTQTHPLHVETATQLGLMNDKAIPDLMGFLLPDSAPAATRRFLRRYLLTPPPPLVCEAMSTLVAFLKEDKNSPSIPPLAVPPLGKVLGLLRAGQASAQVYGELLQSMTATVMVLELETTGECKTMLIEPLMKILEHESGLSANPDSLKARCVKTISLIENVVSPMHHAATTFDHLKDSDSISYFGDLIPSGFLERNEALWRGRVQKNVAKEAYERVHVAAEELAKAVAADFFEPSLEAIEADASNQNIIRKGKNPIAQDMHNNMFAVKEIPDWAEGATRDNYVHPRDRFGKIMKNRFTTDRVNAALSEYVTSCEIACQSVTLILTKLSQDLYDQGHIPAIVQASHSNLILSTAFHHARKANALGWNCVSVYEVYDNQEEGSDSAGFLNNVWPYWMDRSLAVPNTFDMKDLFLLTAPNMSGKSTLMRSTATAALLAVCGLCAPLDAGSKIRRFDHIFVRGASADIPAEQKSAFGAEMGDIAALLRCCGQKSLVFVDELGRGTSPSDGTRLAGAVLEAMAKAGMSGFFATHLHGILNLPLEEGDRIVKKQMAIQDKEYKEGDEINDTGLILASDTLGRHHYQWTYRFTDGVCTDSMALATAAQFGLPEEVLARAEALSPFVPNDFNEVMTKSSQEVTLTDEKLIDDGKTIVTSHPMDEVIQLVLDITGQVPFPVPPGWNAPASLEGQSCVYVLRLPFDDDSGDHKYYVGESDSFSKRLNSHRKKSGIWSSADAIVFPIADGKSEARAVESILIRRMAQQGFPLESTFDGRSLRTSRRNYS